MDEIRLVLGLLVAVVALKVLARLLKIPYPVLLVLGGLVLGFVPGLPQVQLDSDLVFLVFLPSLIYYAALFTSWRDFRANIRPISLLAIGLVVTPTCSVAVMAHAAIEGLSWPAAFVLGAIVSPKDALAATATAQRLGISRRIVTAIGGESLVNDATGLVAYRIALGAVLWGAFSVGEAGLQFVLVSLDGVAVGFGVGRTISWLREHLFDDSSVQNTISLPSPFTAYLLAEEVQVSGVLAVATAGLYPGRWAPSGVAPGTRLQGYAFWEMIVFLLNGFAFILIGLQLPVILEGFSEYSAATLLSYAALVNLSVILVRFVWVFPATYVPVG